MYFNNGIKHIIDVYTLFQFPLKECYLMDERNKLVMLLVDYINMLHLFFEFAEECDIDIGRHVTSVLLEAICACNTFTMEYYLYELRIQLWITHSKQVALEYRDINMCLPASLILEL